MGRYRLLRAPARARRGAPRGHARASASTASRPDVEELSRALRRRRSPRPRRAAARGGSGSAPRFAPGDEIGGQHAREGLHRVAQALVARCAGRGAPRARASARAGGARPRASRPRPRGARTSSRRRSREGLIRNATSAASRWRPRSSSPSRTLRRSALRRRRSRRRRPSIHVPDVAGVRRRVLGVTCEALDRPEQLEEHLLVAQRPGRPLDVAQRAPHLVGVEAPEDRAAHFEQRARATQRDAKVVHGLVVAPRRAGAEPPRRAARRGPGASPRGTGRPCPSPTRAQAPPSSMHPHQAGRRHRLEAQRLGEGAPHGEARRLGDLLVARAEPRPRRATPRSSSSAARACLRADSRRSPSAPSSITPRVATAISPASLPCASTGTATCTAPCDASADRSAITWAGARGPPSRARGPP